MNTMYTKAGIMQMPVSVTARLVFGEILHAAINGVAKGLSIESMARSINVPEADVDTCLRELITLGCVASDTPLSEVATFVPTAVRVNIEMIQGRLEQVVVEESTVSTRELLGYVDRNICGHTYRAAVKPMSQGPSSRSDWYLLSIVRDPGIDGELLVIDKEVPNEECGWKWIEEYFDGFADNQAVYDTLSLLPASFIDAVDEVTEVTVISADWWQKIMDAEVFIPDALGEYKINDRIYRCYQPGTDDDYSVFEEPGCEEQLPMPAGDTSARWPLGELTITTNVQDTVVTATAAFVDGLTRIRIFDGGNSPDVQLQYPGVLYTDENAMRDYLIKFARVKFGGGQ